MYSPISLSNSNLDDIKQRKAKNKWQPVLKVDQI